MNLHVGPGMINYWKSIPSICKIDKLHLAHTVLNFLKGIVKENPSCMHDLAYQTYVTKRGEAYNSIKYIRIAIGSKGGTVGGKAFQWIFNGYALF